MSGGVCNAEPLSETFSLSRLGDKEWRIEVILNVQTLNIIFISASVCSVANGSPTEANYHVCLPKGR